MLPRLDAAVVTPLTPVDPVGAAAPIGDGRQAAFQRALQGMVGQQVPAAVLSKLGDGSFLVKVADNSVRMMLPGDVQVGAEIPLTVVAASPRPVFQLGNGNLPGQAALVYTDSAAAAGGEALYSAPLPSQEAPAYVPGNPRPQPNAGNAATPGQPLTGQGLPAGETEIDPATGLPRPANPASAAAAGAANNAAGAANTAGAAAAAKPALPAGAAASAAAAAAAPSNAAAAPAAPAGAAAGQAGGLAAQLAAQAAGAAEVADTAGAAASQPSQQSAAAAAGTATAAATAEGARPASLGATLLGKAPLTPANELPDLDPNTPQSTLSSTARVLTSVLNTAQGTPGTPGALLALVGKTALFGNAAPQTAELAQKLHDAISQSGLFYESHVTEWVRGERSLPELMREPQMQRMMQNNETAARAAAGPDLAAAQMINQQLHTQEQGRVQWHGEAWPGQPMQWEIRREQREGRQQGNGGSGDGEPEPIWRSGVKFNFPMLGQVSASVMLVGGQVHIQMQTGSDETADTLRAYASQLEQSMEAAGAPLSSLNISQEGVHDK